MSERNENHCHHSNLIMKNNLADIPTVLLFLSFTFDGPGHQESPTSRRYASSNIFDTFIGAKNDL